jgi:hypothetical protein
LSSTQVKNSVLCIHSIANVSLNLLTQIDDSRLVKAIILDQSQFRCDVYSNLNSISQNISLWLNESSIDNLDGKISAIDSYVLFSSNLTIKLTQEIRYNPKYSEINSIVDVVLENNQSISLNLSTKYHSNKIDLVTSDGLIKFNCSIKNSGISCQKIIINENSPFDIYFLYFKILSQNVEMTRVQDGFLIYSKKKFHLHS